MLEKKIFERGGTLTDKNPENIDFYISFYIIILLKIPELLEIF